MGLPASGLAPVTKVIRGRDFKNKKKKRKKPQQ
jgi:hypothetical protein